MTNLIVCCDGTWNTPDQRESGLPAPTNVVKIYRALAPTDAAGAEQKSYYHPGVGTDGSRLQRLTAGGLGDGLDGHVKSAYQWLARTYREGDRIFLFGFSRGAYTVRSTAGMIARCGLLDLRAAEPQVAWDAVDAIFQAYRDATPCRATASQPFFHTTPGDNPAGKTTIHFLGVWDTVGALGIPDFLWFAKPFDRRRHEFHDTRLGAAVCHARHAVAIDEQRESFLPTLWSNVATHSDAKQVWFPGVHGDVGGGYAVTDLSNGALAWMMEEAQAQDLAFWPGALKSAVCNAEGIMHDSFTGIFRDLPTRPRPVPPFDDATLAGGFHEGALSRHKGRGLGYDRYWTTLALEEGKPIEFDVYAADPWNRTGLHLRAGRRYRFRASGRWLDRNAPCGPEGMDDGVFHPDEIAQSLSSALGWGESLTRMLTGNEGVEFRFTRRRDDLPWFCLCGAVANGGIADDSGKTRPHQSFMIGEGVTFEPEADGYLYCFANDAWSFYGNNRGSVHVTVEALPASG